MFFEACVKEHRFNSLSSGRHKDEDGEEEFKIKTRRKIRSCTAQVNGD